MSHRTFHQAAGVMFTLAFIGHLLRVVQGWDIMLGELLVPMWVSWCVFIVAGLLAWTSFRRARGK